MLAKHPSDITMATPNGPMPFCEYHGIKYANLLRFMGQQPTIFVTGDEPKQECANCANEAKKRESSEVHS